MSLDLVVKELERVNVEIMGVSYSLTLPTVRQIRNFTRAYKEAIALNDEEKVFDVVEHYLSELGMTKDHIDNMQMSVLVEVCKLLNKAKKN